MRPDDTVGADEPLDGLRWGWTAAGVVLAVAGSAVAARAESDIAFAGFATLFVGTLVLTYGATGPLTRAAAAVARPLGTAGYLAAAQLARSPRRAWTTIAAVMVATGIVIGIGGTTANQRATFLRQGASLGAADLWVQTTPGDQLPARFALPEGLTDRVAALPEVARVVPGWVAWATHGSDRVIFEGFPPESNAPAVAAATPAARRALAEGGAAIVEGTFARRHGVSAGDVLEVATPAGHRRVRVADRIDIASPPGGGIVVFGADDFRQWFAPGPPTTLEVHAAPGAEAAEIEAAVRRLTAGAGVPVFVFTGEESLAAFRSSLDQALAFIEVTRWAVVAATALAVLNTLGISVLERRREMGIVRAVGMGRRRLAGVVLAEAAAIGVVGSALGVATGLLEHRVADAALENVTGFRIDYAIVPGPLLLAGAVAVAVVVFGALAPARRAARLDVLEAIGYE